MSNKKRRSERGPPYRFKVKTEGGRKGIVAVNAPTYDLAEMRLFEKLPEKAEMFRTHASKKQAHSETDVYLSGWSF